MGLTTDTNHEKINILWEIIFMGLIEKIGLIASCALPLFNIPLIVRMKKRKSADDIRLTWLFGVWGCIVFMMPAALSSSDVVFRVYGITNLILFSAVVWTVMQFKRKAK